MKKLTFMLLAVLTAVVSYAAYGTLWDAATGTSETAGEYSLITIEKAKFAGAKVGDTIRVNITEVGKKPAAGPRRTIHDGNITLLDTKGETTYTLGSATGLKSGVEKFDFVITDDMLTKINAAEAIYVRYQYLTVTSVELIAKKIDYYPFDGVAYIIDAESGKFMAAGHDWGTRGIVNEYGLDLTFTSNQETKKVTIDTKVSNGGNSHFLGSNLYMDAAAYEWGLEYKDFGFWISDADGKYISIDANDNLVLSDTPREWIIVTVEGVTEQRLEELAGATETAPMDATWMLQNPNFNRNDQRVSAWTVSADCTNKNLNGGNNVNNCAESYHSTFTISQTLTSAPKGVYALTAQGFYRQDAGQTEDAPVFFANEETATVPVKAGTENNMSEASESFTKGSYTIEPIFVEVGEDGALTVGVKGTATSQWVIFDNFKLSYYGANANLDNLKNAALVAELRELRAKATELKEQVEVESVKTAISEALEATANVSGTDALNAAIATLKAVIEKAEVHITANAALTAMQNIMDGTNVYTAEALANYKAIYDAAKLKYEAGELTKADAIENPETVMNWHNANVVDDLLLSAWSIGATKCKDYDASLYINTWSVEGETDGSEFKVPFFEYWVSDANSLAADTLSATLTDVEAGEYEVTAWVRVRIKNGAEAPAAGITMSANDGEAVNVADGTQVGTSQMYLKDVVLTAVVGEDGVLKIQFNVADDNNISWLSFKNVKYTKKQAEEEDALVVVPEDATIEEDWTIDGIYRGWDGEQWQAVPIEQTTKVAIKDNEIYVQGLAYFFEDAWIKGVINGEEAIFASGQFVGEDQYGPEYLNGSDDGNTIAPIKFTWDAASNTLSLQNYILECPAKESLGAYGYWQALDIYKGVPEIPEPVVAPENLVTEQYSLVAKDNEGNPVFGVLNVGFDGNDVYFQGFSTYLPDAWVKGTLSEDGKTVTLAADQYMGSYYGTYDMYFSYKSYDIELEYDAEAGKFTASNVIKICNSQYYFDYYVGAVITKVVEVAATPANPSILGITQGSYYDDILLYSVPTVDTEGNGLLTSKLSFQFYTDIDGTVAPLTFTTDDYKKLTEDMSVIPYGFTDNYDFYTDQIYLNMDFSTWTRIGIKSIYTGGGETHETEIQWYELKDPTGIADIMANDANARYFDLQGRSVEKNAKGMLIKQIRQADGTVRNIKVLKK